MRELDERLGFSELIQQHLTDPRGKNTQLLLADQLAAAVGENRRTFDQACPLLLAATGREPSDSATVWEHGPADRLAALASRVGEPQTGADFGEEVGRGGKGV